MSCRHPHVSSIDRQSIDKMPHGAQPTEKKSAARKIKKNKRKYIDTCVRGPRGAWIPEQLLKRR
jgi:hypothetical protein